jgi:hypothetical protein
LGKDLVLEYIKTTKSSAYCHAFMFLKSLAVLITFFVLSLLSVVFISSPVFAACRNP